MMGIQSTLKFNAHTHISLGCKNRTIKYRGSIGYDVINRDVASLQCPIFTPMTYGHERLKNDKESFLAMLY